MKSKETGNIWAIHDQLFDPLIENFECKQPGSPYISWLKIYLKKRSIQVRGKSSQTDSKMVLGTNKEDKYNYLVEYKTGIVMIGKQNNYGFDSVDPKFESIMLSMLS